MRFSIVIVVAEDPSFFNNNQRAGLPIAFWVWLALVTAGGLWLKLQAEAIQAIQGFFKRPF
jgi:hypothetical protein